MKQIIQNLKNGETSLAEVPVPIVKHGHVLIKTQKSIVSLGTEKMLVNFGKANYIQKARQQPEKVKQVINKIRTDGLKPTIESVFRKLNEPLPLGYCNAGVVVGIGEGVDDFNIGDRVISNGSHAEYVNIPKNLVAKIPENVSYDKAVFTVVGAIGLQGIRLFKPSFGETVVVIGLGLIGLITSQILIANGCNVIGIDYDEKKIEIAKQFGVKTFNAKDKNINTKITQLTSGNGADGVIITASSTSNDIISDSAKMCHVRGRIILVGVIGLNINRTDFYDKEISFQVSCSYGPGRYDINYEEKGLDYPIGFIRWTENRNFLAILNSLSKNQINVEKLITQRVHLNQFHEIYSNLSDKDAIASIIEYDEFNPQDKISNIVNVSKSSFDPSKGVVGIIGAGNFTAATIVPTLSKCKAQIKYIASSRGLSGTVLAKKYKISNSVTDYNLIIKDSEVDAVIITTRHNMHATQIINSISNNKHVFVEKPLAINKIELKSIKQAMLEKNLTITVGFNRRFSPFSMKAKELIGNSPGQISVIATMNAGLIPKKHWTQDMEIGGGRIIGEACHYIDLISYFTSDKIKSVLMAPIGKEVKENIDTASIFLKYKNGSLGVINYFSNGNKSYPKERIEIFQNGKNIVIDNFRKIEFYGYSSKNFSKSQDKGHKNLLKNWYSCIKNGGSSLISLDSIYNTTSASFSCIESIKKNKWIDVE